MKKHLLIGMLFSASLFAQKIDRKALVTRHNVQITAIDTLASLTVGNGAFAFTVDVLAIEMGFSYRVEDVVGSDPSTV